MQNCKPVFALFAWMIVSSVSLAQTAPTDPAAPATTPAPAAETPATSAAPVTPSTPVTPPVTPAPPVAETPPIPTPPPAAAAPASPPTTSVAPTARGTIVRSILAENDVKRREILVELTGQVDPAVPVLLDAWKGDKLYIYTTPEAVSIPVLLNGDKNSGPQEAVVVETGEPLKDAAGAPLLVDAKTLKPVKHNNNIRRTMKGVLDVLLLSSPDLSERLKAIETMGNSQSPDYLEGLQARAKVEKESTALTALRQGIALIQLKDPSDDVKIAALKELKALHPLATADMISASLKQAETDKKPAVAEAATAALAAIESHRSVVNFFGTMFRGTSLGSILLIAALGLAITFGLMGVINMAHGEMIAVGAYTTYIVQNVFGNGLDLSPFGFSISLPGMHTTGAWYESYFLFAIPLSFLVAAGVGIALERGIIQFLYRRPLESLLATWGVSLVLQQVFRLVFGANNVQVNSPVYLSGNWTFMEIVFNWNRVFVITFAILIVIGTWLVLTRTSLGLLMRAVMQNRNMAACMGVRTNRVNMLTFGFGSGLAGLAGAFLSQIGNVGPSMGQSHIVDCFMTVVVGGVGNIAGTVVSALGIGLADQSLQQILGNPVMGKILVLVSIILFLQWRPAGIFVTRSRSLD